MSTNLLDSLKGYITPELISQASARLGESEDGVSKAVSSSLPTLLGGLLSKTSDSSTMGGVMDLVTKFSQDSSDSGLNSSLLNMLFGNKLSGVTDLIANASGVKSASAGSILSMAVPMLLEHLGKTGTTLSGLISMLFTQKDAILASAPAGLSSLVHLSDIGNVGSIVNNSGANNVPSNNSGGGGFPKWLLPFLLILGGLFALYYFTKGFKREGGELDSISIENVDSVATNLTNDVSNAVDSMASTGTDESSSTVNALGNMFKFKLPNGVELNAPEKGIENQLVTWMNDKSKIVDKTTWFNFDRLLFDTGKATLKAESMEQLKNIAEVLKAYPSMEIKLGGYTDNVGNPQSNLKLSDERAKAVMAELVKLGIETKRLTAEGYGDQHPVASNDTEEGRLQNRRIAIRVTKK